MGSCEQRCYQEQFEQAVDALRLMRKRQQDMLSQRLGVVAGCEVLGLIEVGGQPLPVDVQLIEVQLQHYCSELYTTAKCSQTGATL